MASCGDGIVIGRGGNCGCLSSGCGSCSGFVGSDWFVFYFFDFLESRIIVFGLVDWR